MLDVISFPEIKATVIRTVGGRRSVESTRIEKHLLDFLGDVSTAISSGSAAASTPVQMTDDLLADLFSDGSARTATPSSPASTPLENSIQDVLGLFNKTLAAGSPTSISTLTPT
ncbi:hypothetical protein FRC12_008700 [Ceratobasidium sp. 428]|nr:hypothetical protein FRC12_008700 [Ceratobasidium sp. 428]